MFLACIEAKCHCFMQTISCSHFQTFHSETPYMKEEAQLRIAISFPLGMRQNCPAT